MSTLNFSDLPETLRKAYIGGCYHQSLDINQNGIWKIYGPLPECGSNKLIQYAEGKFIDVLAYAMTLPKFVDFGCYGFLEEFVVPQSTKIDSTYYDKIVSQEKAKFLKEREDLIKRLSVLNEILN